MKKATKEKDAPTLADLQKGLIEESKLMKTLLSISENKVGHIDANTRVQILASSIGERFYQFTLFAWKGYLQEDPAQYTISARGQAENETKFEELSNSFVQNLIRSLMNSIWTEPFVLSNALPTKFLMCEKTRDVDLELLSSLINVLLLPSLSLHSRGIIGRRISEILYRNFQIGMENITISEKALENEIDLATPATISESLFPFVLAFLFIASEKSVTKDTFKSSLTPIAKLLEQKRSAQYPIEEAGIIAEAIRSELLSNPLIIPNAIRYVIRQMIDIHHEQHHHEQNEVILQYLYFYCSDLVLRLVAHAIDRPEILGFTRSIMEEGEKERAFLSAIVTDLRKSWDVGRGYQPNFNWLRKFRFFLLTDSSTAPADETLFASWTPLNESIVMPITVLKCLLKNIVPNLTPSPTSENIELVQKCISNFTHSMVYIPVLKNATDPLNIPYHLIEAVSSMRALLPTLVHIPNVLNESQSILSLTSNLMKLDWKWSGLAESTAKNLLKLPALDQKEDFANVRRAMNTMHKWKMEWIQNQISSYNQSSGAKLAESIKIDEMARHVYHIENQLKNIEVTVLLKKHYGDDMLEGIFSSINKIISDFHLTNQCECNTSSDTIEICKKCDPLYSAAWNCVAIAENFAQKKCPLFEKDVALRLDKEIWKRLDSKFSMQVPLDSAIKNKKEKGKNYDTLFLRSPSQIEHVKNVIKRFNKEYDPVELRECVYKLYSYSNSNKSVDAKEILLAALQSLTADEDFIISFQIAAKLL